MDTPVKKPNPPPIQGRRAQEVQAVGSWISNIGRFRIYGTTHTLSSYSISHFLQVLLYVVKRKYREF